EQEATERVHEQRAKAELAVKAPARPESPAQAEQQKTERQLVELRRVHRVRGELLGSQTAPLDLFYPGGSTENGRDVRIPPAREATEGTEPLRRAFREPRAKVTALEVAAHANQHHAARQHRSAGVEPLPETLRSLSQEPRGGAQCAQQRPGAKEPSLPQGKQLELRQPGRACGNEADAREHQRSQR